MGGQSSNAATGIYRVAELSASPANVWGLEILLIARYFQFQTCCRSPVLGLQSIISSKWSNFPLFPTG
jgi:hypothetical protein